MGGELTIPLALKQSWSQGDPKHVPIALRQQLGIVSAVGDRPRPEVHRLNAAFVARLLEQISTPQTCVAGLRGYRKLGRSSRRVRSGQQPALRQLRHKGRQV